MLKQDKSKQTKNGDTWEDEATHEKQGISNHNGAKQTKPIMKVRKQFIKNENKTYIPK